MEFSARDGYNDFVVDQTGTGEFDEEGSGLDKKPKLSLADKEKSSRDTSPVKPEKSTKNKPPSSLLKPAKPDKKEKGCLTTDYIIEGDAEVSIEISTEATK